MADAYVYALLREDGTPFYVGKGRGDRWLAHEADCRPGRSHKDNVIAGMKARGIAVPKRKFAEGLTDQEALALEVQIIARIGRTCDGGPLTNLTAGGDGLCNPSPEVRAKIAASLTGRVNGPHSEETRARISAAHKGKRCAPPPTPETTAKRVASLAASWAAMSPEQRARRGMAGKTHSAETRARMRQAALGRVLSAETRAKIGAAGRGRPSSRAMLGRKHSDETRAKMRAAHAARLERSNV